MVGHGLRTPQDGEAFGHTCGLQQFTGQGHGGSDTLRPRPGTAVVVMGTADALEIEALGRRQRQRDGVQVVDFVGHVRVDDEREALPLRRDLGDQPVGLCVVICHGFLLDGMDGSAPTAPSAGEGVGDRADGGDDPSRYIFCRHAGDR